jgi:hypothetical protein
MFFKIGAKKKQSMSPTSSYVLSFYADDDCVEVTSALILVPFKRAFHTVTCFLSPAKMQAKTRGIAETQK